MDIAVALDRPNSRRDLTLNAGDGETINLTVYRQDGNSTPLTTEVQTPQISFWPELSMSIPVGSAFTVPDTYDRAFYRLTASVDGVRRTLCSGILWIRGAQQWTGRWDYGGPAGWSAYP